MGINRLANRFIIAQWVSYIFDPFHVTFGLLVFVVIWSFPSWTQRLLWIVLFGVASLTVPRVILEHFRQKGEIKDLGVNLHRERLNPLLFASLMLVIAIAFFLAVFFVQVTLLTTVMTIYLLGFVFGYVLTRFWKVSGHTSIVSVVLTLFVLLFGVKMIFLFIVLPLVAWARIYLSRHSLWETVIGTIIGISITLTVYSCFY